VRKGGGQGAANIADFSTKKSLPRRLSRIPQKKPTAVHADRVSAVGASRTPPRECRLPSGGPLVAGGTADERPKPQIAAAKMAGFLVICQQGSIRPKARGRFAQRPASTPVKGGTCKRGAGRAGSRAEDSETISPVLFWRGRGGGKSGFFRLPPQGREGFVGRGREKIVYASSGRPARQFSVASRGKGLNKSYPGGCTCCPRSYPVGQAGR